METLHALPEVHVELDGVPLADADARAVGRVEVVRSLSLPAQCEVVLRDPAGPLGRGEQVPVGARFRLGVGANGDTLFLGQVTAANVHYGPSLEREVRLRGYDALHLLRQHQPVRNHVEVTPADLARELAGRVGLSVSAGEDGPLHHRICQFRQTDLELLSAVTAGCGLYFQLEGEELRLFPLSGTGRAVALALGEDLLELDAEVNADPACQKVAALGWDPWRAVPHSGRADHARAARPPHPAARPDRFGASGERTLTGTLVQSDRQTDSLAQAQLDRCRSRETQAHGVCLGDTRLGPGVPVELTGTGESLAGRYVVASVRHTLDRERGFLTEFDTALPSPGSAGERADAGERSDPVASLGVVRRVDDPEDLGRVQVSLPGFGDLESSWLEVLLPAAGPGKGMVALPDVDDRVLVLFPDADPAQGVVLGGMYGPAGPADEVVAGGSIDAFSLLTAGGQRLRLDDGEEAVRLENDRGSFVELTPDKVTLHAECDLEIAAPGHNIVIRGGAVDFRRG